MKVTPVMQSSAYEMNKSQELSSKKRPSLSRQGSYPSSSEQQNSIDNDPNPNQQRPRHSLLLKIVENIYFQIFITVLTVITLFLYDLKTIICSKDQDFAIGISNCIFFCLFMVEVCMNCKTQGYFCSFFFYLDIISTITILFDVDFVIDALFNQSNNLQISSFVAKSKASRVAARAVRVVKIFRLTRVAKLYKSTQKAKQLNQKQKNEILMMQNNRFRNKKRNEGENSGILMQEYSNFASKHNVTKKGIATNYNIQRYQLQNDSIKQKDESGNDQAFINSRSKASKAHIQSSSQLDSELQNKESQISKILTEDTIKKIIIIILLIMMSIPLLNISNYQTISTQWDYSVMFAANALANGNISMATVNQFVKMQVEAFPGSGAQSSFVCVDSPFNELASCMNVDFSRFRTSDLGVFSQPINTSAIMQIRPNLTLQNGPHLSAISIFVDYAKYNSIDSAFSMATTVFICLTIIYLLSEFSNNINELVIIPIEKMLALIRVKDFKEEQAKDKENKEEQYETKLVQNAIIKIKALMETIYGPLGNDLVQEKMLNNHSISANLQESMKKSFCVAGLCRLNHVSKITEVLGQDVFGFVNQIALIVHNAAFRYGGYCTKILDQGFLLIFKIPPAQIQKYKIEEDIDPIQLAKSTQKTTTQTYLNTFCDFAIFAALKTLARIVKQPKLFKYRNDQRLLVSFGGVSNIQINFAFTMGWCYQAVLGSSHKIDPLFLGQEINHLQRVIRITKNYPSSIIITDSLYANLSNGLKHHTRPFDSIKFDETEMQKTLYIVDYDTSNVAPSVSKAEKSLKDAKDLKTKKGMNMIYLDGQISSDKVYDAIAFIESKKELQQILKKSSGDQTRRKKYEIAFMKYLRGDWQDIQELLQNQNLKSDMPAQRLYTFLLHYKFKSPPQWKGFRDYPSLFEKSRS